MSIYPTEAKPEEREFVDWQGKRYCVVNHSDVFVWIENRWQTSHWRRLGGNARIRRHLVRRIAYGQYAERETASAAIDASRP